MKVSMIVLVYNNLKILKDLRFPLFRVLVDVYYHILTYGIFTLFSVYFSGILYNVNFFLYLILHSFVIFDEVEGPKIKNF